MDNQMLRARLDSINTAVREYRQQESELRELARTSASIEHRNAYTTQADDYRLRIRELVQDMASIRPRTQLPTRQPNISRTTSTNISRHTAVSRADSYTIPHSRPLSIPDTIPETIPNEFLCPITTEIMKDPVMLTDGHVYEKQAIKQWLSNHDTSPMTKLKVDKNIIIPCFVLRKLIQDFISNSNCLDTNQQLKKKHTKSKELLINNKPKRQPSRYNIFVKEQMPRVKEQHPGLPLTELIKIVATEWNMHQQQAQ
jgi:hypothetical protein